MRKIIVAIAILFPIILHASNSGNVEIKTSLMPAISSQSFTIAGLWEATRPAMPIPLCTADDYMQKAERRYWTAAGLGAGGIALIGVGLWQTEPEVAVAGITLIVVGATVAITGKYYLVEAHRINKKEVMQIKAANSGLGLAFCF